MLRLGRISYTNVLPIYYYFEDQHFKDRIQVIPQIPAQLNREMKNGHIDLGAISSFAYAENHENYSLLPDLSVSCKGKVRSIFLFSKRKIEDLADASIALTSSSATSIALLKVLLEHFYQLKVSYQTMPPVLDEMMKEHDAALLIGDDALLASWRNQQYPYMYDLCELWYHFTKKYMTFAVWAVRKEVTLRYPDLLAEIYEEFMRSKQKGISQRSELIANLCQSFGGEASFWQTYFSGISYDFREEQKEGLEYFYQLAYQIGLLPYPLQVEIWEPKDAVFL